MGTLGEDFPYGIFTIAVRRADSGFELPRDGGPTTHIIKTAIEGYASKREFNRVKDRFLERS